jgi:hypothetical protein
MTMKMISNTSMTSTIGVTLMLELTFFPSSLLTIAICAPPGHYPGRAFRSSFLVANIALALKTAGAGHVSAPLRCARFPLTDYAITA